MVAVACLSCAQVKEARYLALGDSFTIGTGSSEADAFPTRVAALATKRGANVVLKNVAVNGYSTQELHDEQLPVVKAFRPTHLTIAIGANDIVRGRGPADYRRNLQRIFAVLESDGVDPSRVWALPQPEWSRAPVAQAFGDPEDLSAQINRYNAILADEVMAFGGNYVDLFPLMKQQAAQKLVAPDGLHPSASAHAAWAEQLDRELSLR